MSIKKHDKKHMIPKAVNSLQDECIRVQKVYDWVTDTLTVTKMIDFSKDQLQKIEAAMENPNRRPLRIVCSTPKTPPLFPLSSSCHKKDDDFFCEQIGEKRDVIVPLNGDFVEAQLVDLLFTTDVKLQVVDRHGHVVTDLKCNASVFESFVLCFPDGTDLFCRITKIICRIPSGTVLLNCPAPRSFQLEVTFCIDIQVEAEVKLEVLAKFCSPRENDLIAPDVIDKCPPVTFPEQCPDIFPRPNCDCSLSGEGSGMTTGADATEIGQAALLVNICDNCSLTNSSLKFSFRDTDTSDGIRNFNFIANHFDQETLSCEACDDGLKFMINGTGRRSNGEVFDFRLAVVDSKLGDQFELHLIDDEGEVVFNTGTVNVIDGDLTVKDCVTFNDIKFKRP